MRLFRCKICGHKMRFGRSRCGNCLRRTPPWNRTSTYLIVAAIAIFAYIFV